MAKTIIIDTEVKGVEEASAQIEGLDSQINEINNNKVSVKFDTAKTEKSLENLQKTGEKIEKVGQGIAGGFALATGVVGSFGSELGFSSDEIENAQQKATSFISILVSIKPVLEGVKEGFGLLGKVLKGNPLILLATILGGIIISMLDMGAVMDGLKKGFKVIGEVAGKVFDTIVSGIDYAIELNLKLFDIMTLGLTDTAGAYENYKKGVEEANQLEREREKLLAQERDAINKTIAALKSRLNILNDEIILIEEQKAVVTDRYNEEIALAQASGKETFEIEQQKLIDLIAFTEKEIALKEERYKIEEQLILQNEKLVNNVFGSQLNSLIQNNEELKKQRETDRKSRNDDLSKLKTDLKNFNLDVKVNEAKHNKELSDASVKAKEEELNRKKALEELYAEEDRKFKEEIQQEYLKTRKAAVEEEIQLDLDVLENQVRINEQKSVEDTIAYTDELKLQREVNASKLQMAADSLGALMTLTTLFGKNNEENAKKSFQVNKALSIAQALIQTYQAVTGALTAGGNPIKLATGAQFVEAGIALTSGLAAVSKIASTQFGGGGTGGGGVSGIGSAPSLPTVDTSSTPFQFPSIATNQENSMPTQSVVSVVEINSVQNRVNVAEANATF